MSTFSVLSSIDFFFSPHSVCFVLSLLPGVFIGHPMGERHTGVEVEGESDSVTQRGGEIERQKEIKRGRRDER